MIRARVNESSSGKPVPEEDSSECVRQIGEPDVESVLESNAELSPGRFAASEDADVFTMNVADEEDKGAAGRGKSSDAPKKAANRTEETDSDASDASDASDEDGGDAEAMPTLEPHELQRAIEAIIFSTGEPVTIRQLAEVFEVSVHDVREVVESIRSELEDSQRAFNLVEIGGGLQFLTQPRYHPWVSRFRHKRKAQRLSPAALETLAVIAYKQPISKAKLESIRGVQCSPILKTLLDRDLVKIVGREETLGRPLLYGTTQSFLENFGLGSIHQLPEPEIEKTHDEPDEE